ncbi:hypothetical protein FB45DRAFT_1064530 [Roridomyces roridus]|uniref:Concanavalin A-like lectin/glucanase n=1 Tax=Roridomyces roridus TaxID=1738132 RepID=A0AAD7B9R5_9AGAR|nr:hypothetical protein FB45DRAFT_1064530 [Roridomyces roridus]
MRLGFLTLALFPILGLAGSVSPGGVQSKTSYLVPSGSRITHVGDEIHVLDPDGTTVHPTPQISSRTPISSRQEESGYIAFAFWASPDQTSNVIASFNTTWTVPPDPETSNGQLVYYFNSINQQAGASTIIQPVLQWGVSPAGGGDYWSVASWYLFNGSEIECFTTPVRVNAGDVLHANIELTSTTAGTAYNYTVEFSNVPGTTLHVENAVEAYTAALETLEAYGVTSASDYPTGTTVFEDIQMRMQDGSVPSLMWGIQNDEADGISMVIDKDGAEGGRLTLVY